MANFLSEGGGKKGGKAGEGKKDGAGFRTLGQDGGKPTDLGNFIKKGKKKRKKRGEKKKKGADESRFPSQPEWPMLVRESLRARIEKGEKKGGGGKKKRRKIEESQRRLPFGIIQRHPPFETPLLASEKKKRGGGGEGKKKVVGGERALVFRMIGQGRLIICTGPSERKGKRKEKKRKGRGGGGKKWGARRFVS